MKTGKKKPKISVVIPCFNAALTIGRSIASIRAQAHQNVQLIVMDGGSDDETEAVVRPLLKTTDTFMSEKDDGQLHALRKGLAVATGEICFWLNADDMVAPGAFCYVADLFASDPGLDFIFSDDWVFHEQRRKVYVGQTIRWLTLADHFVFYRQMPSECVYWRTALNSHINYWDYSLRVATDYMVMLQLQKSARKRRWVPRRLGIFVIRANGQQMSQRFKSRVAAERLRIRGVLRCAWGMNRAQFLAARRSKRSKFLWQNIVLPFCARVCRIGRRVLTFDCERHRLLKFVIDCEDLYNNRAKRSLDAG